MGERFVRFRVVNGKLEAEVFGMQGPKCEEVLKDTLDKGGLSLVPGSINHKPEYNLDELQEGQRVAN